MAVIMNAYWASDDGSYGEGAIGVLDPNSLNVRQLRWLELLEETGEVYAEDLVQISENRKPDRLDK